MASYNLLGITATSDALNVSRSISALAADAPHHAYATVLWAADELVKRIRINASNASPSSPGQGPGVAGEQTPAYRDSWSFRMFTTGTGGWTAVVGTDYPQGRRLEWGFMDTDALGRTYNQKPRPHVGPGVDSVEPEFAAKLFELGAL